MLISTKSYHAKHTSILSKNIQIKPSSCGRLAHAANTKPMLYPATKTTACCVSPRAPVPRPSRGPTRRNAAKAKNPMQTPRSPRRCMRAPRKFIPTRMHIISTRWRPILTGRPLSAVMICGSTGGTWTVTTRASVSFHLQTTFMILSFYNGSNAVRSSVNFLSLIEASMLLVPLSPLLTLSYFLIPTFPFRRGGH